MSVSISLLADYSQIAEAITSAIQKEWPDWYSSRGDAVYDVRNSCRRHELPVRFVALNGEKLVGTICLKQHSTDNHTHLSPWLAGLWVEPSHRYGRIGFQLMCAASDHARLMGFSALYASTARERNPSKLWHRIGCDTESGDPVVIFRLALPRSKSLRAISPPSR